METKCWTLDQPRQPRIHQSKVHDTLRIKKRLKLYIVIVLEQEKSFIDIHKIISGSKVKPLIAKVI